MSGIEHVRIERLDVDNYATWSTRIRLLLVSRGLWTAVKGQLSAGSEADSKADEQALALIGLSVNDHHLTTIASCETAKQAWDALEAVYHAKSVARRLQLKRTLNSLRKEPNEELSKYVAHAKDIRDQLAAAGWSPDDQEAVTSKANRTRLTQFRTGSHWLGVESGRWQGLQREQRRCKRCECDSIDDAAHMIWGCPALVDQRLQHVELFSDSQPTIEAFLQQEPTELALFLRRCYNQCAALEDWGSS